MYSLSNSVVLLALLALRNVVALNCNICGPGTNNIMTNHLGVVVINYEGVDYRQNCQKWQESKLISEEWCEENMLRLTFDICKCMTAQGTLVRDLMTEAPTESPTVPDVAPVSAPTTTTQASPPSGSSISTCVSGAVAEVIASTMVKWQATNLISEQWCEENMIRLAYDICKCITAHETLTRDVTTEPPTESLAIDNAVESCSEVSSTPGSNPTSEQGLSYDQSFPKNGETQEGALESTVGSHSSSNPREERSAPTPADDKTASQMLEGNDQEATTSATQRNPQTMNRSNANRLTDKFASYCLALYLAAHFVAR